MSPTNDTNETQIGGLRLTLVMTALCLTVFLTGMDQTILAAAAPTISNQFHTLNDIGWWTDIYLLSVSSFQLVYGKLYSLFSIKAIYITAIVLFEIGSLICTTAPNSTALICGRAIAGLGAAGIFAGAILIITKIIPLSRRAVYLGMLSSVFGVAAIAGPFIGGALTDRSTWRWCFGINLPLGAFTVFICILLVHVPSNPDANSLTLREKLSKFDLIGTTLMVAGLVCLLLGLQWGGSVYPWGSGRVIALLVVAGIVLSTFAILQASPITFHSRSIPKSIMEDYNIWLAVSYAMAITGGIYVVILYLPVWSQGIRNKTALTSGIMLTPTIAGYVVCSVIAGGATSAIGYYNPGMIAGTILCIAGAALLTTLKPEISNSRLVGYELLYGFGAGLGFGQPNYIVQTLLPEADIPIGVTFITLVQNLSASIFVAVAQSVFQNAVQKNFANLGIQGNASSLHMQTGASDILSKIPKADQAKARDAYSDAVVRTFYISLALSCATVFGAVGVRWQSMKAPKALKSDAGEEREPKSKACQ